MAASFPLSASSGSVPRVWTRDERVIYEADPMLFGVMSVRHVKPGTDQVLCRVVGGGPSSFEWFAAGSLAEAPELVPVGVAGDAEKVR
jgi:hypothetical protein